MTVGDVNSNAKGSGARYNEGKPDFSLIPLCTLEDEARVWEYGKKKYAAWNWCKGMDWSVPFACLMRHMSRWQAGEENDAESGLPHLAHAMCNLRMLTLFANTYKEGDTRPIKWLEEFFKETPVKEDVKASTQNDNLPIRSLAETALDKPYPQVLTNLPILDTSPRSGDWEPLIGFFRD